jgi:hypothetical protein
MTKKRAPKVPPPSDLDDRSEVGGEGVDEFKSVELAFGPHGAVFVPIPPVGIARLHRDAVARLGHLQDAVMQRRQLLDEIDDHVAELRALNVSWNIIGWSVGTSAEAARQRWS